MQSDCMKRLTAITALAIALLGNTAHATPTHLTCKDLSATQDGISDALQARPVLVDPDTGMATIYGKKYELTVHPNELVLRSVATKNSRYISQVSNFAMKMNRSTLSFTLRHKILTNGVHTEILSEGQCEVIPAPAGRKI